MTKCKCKGNTYLKVFFKRVEHGMYIVLNYCLILMGQVFYDVDSFGCSFDGEPPQRNSRNEEENN